MMWEPGFGGFFWMPLVWLAMAGLVVWLVIVLVRPRTPRPVDRAQESLEERYARGQIDRDEFPARRTRAGRQVADRDGQNLKGIRAFSRL